MTSHGTSLFGIHTRLYEIIYVLVAVPVKNGLKPNGFKPKKDNAVAILIL